MLKRGESKSIDRALLHWNTQMVASVYAPLRPVPVHGIPIALSPN